MKGGVWFSLMDKVESAANLRSSFRKVRKNKGAAGIDRVPIAVFEKRLEDNLSELGRSLREGRYRPSAVMRVHIPKAGSRETRPLGIPTVRDRVVQTALRNVLEPIFERGFAEHSYGFRPGRGAQDALARVSSLLESGHVFVVDADLRKYFDTIPHEPLMKLVREKVADGRVLKLVEMFLDQKVIEDLESWTPIRGTPQGAVISPLLSNIYLDPLDHLMAAAGFEMVRYADDFVVLCRSRRKAEEALATIRRWVETVGLSLHPEKTRLVEAPAEAFEFLGFRFVRGHRIPRDASLKKLRENLRAKTPRLAGESLPRIVEVINRTLRGWLGYFSTATTANTFQQTDKWLRMRLRSILRRRSGGRGRGRGLDHNRWPNSYFREVGLFSLTEAYKAIRQPPRG